MDYQKTIIAVATLTHQKFIDIYKRDNNGSRVKKTTDKVWIKKHGTDQADLAKLNFLSLPSDWQKERWSGAKVALDCVLEAIKNNRLFNADFIEYASDLVHQDWLSRNSIKAEDRHKLSYKNLSEEDKDKDRIFVTSALEIYNQVKNKFI